MRTVVLWFGKSMNVKSVKPSSLTLKRTHTWIL